ncbi:IS66 family insertion sequence element accessory protein TnpB [soil metagenome]
MQLFFSERLRYFVYRTGCDMRKGYDGLSGIVRNEYKLDPLSGDVFVFFSRQLNKIKVLHFQGDGFAILSKRLERGTFEMPNTDSASTAIEISSEQLQFILKGIVLSSVKKRARYEHTIVDKNPALMRLSAG